MNRSIHKRGLLANVWERMREGKRECYMGLHKRCWMSVVCWVYWENIARKRKKSAREKREKKAWNGNKIKQKWKCQQETFQEQWIQKC